MACRFYLSIGVLALLSGAAAAQSSKPTIQNHARSRVHAAVTQANLHAAPNPQPARGLGPGGKPCPTPPDQSNILGKILRQDDAMLALLAHGYIPATLPVMCANSDSTGILCLDPSKDHDGGGDDSGNDNSQEQQNELNELEEELLGWEEGDDPRMFQTWGGGGHGGPSTSSTHTPPASSSSSSTQGTYQSCPSNQ